MEAFLIAFSTIAIAEMGDRTQLLSLVLTAQYRKPWPIIAGIFLATLANHAAAGFIGVWFGRYLTPTLLDACRRCEHAGDGRVDTHPGQTRR